MNIKTLGFANARHSEIQGSSVTQVSSHIPIATIMSASETSEIEGGCFRSTVSRFENYCKEVIWLYKNRT